MAITDSIVLSYAVLVALLVLALGTIVIWSRREFRMRIIALALMVATAVACWVIFTDLPGRTKDITVEEFKDKYWCATVVHEHTEQGKGMYLLIRKKDEKEATYIFVPWNMKLANSLQKGQRIAKLNKSGAIVYGGKSCFSGEDDEEYLRDEGGSVEGKPSKQKKSKPKVTLPGSSGNDETEIAEDEFHFRPDPVPPTPEKNYGPIYEEPLRMPDKK